MDTTDNPLVALYFATSQSQNDENGAVVYFSVPNLRKKYYDSDTISCISNLSNLSETEKKELLDNIESNKQDFNELPSVKRLLQFIRVEKPHFTSSIEPVELNIRWFVFPKLSNRRIIAQNGSFIISGLSNNRKLPEGQKPIKHYNITVAARAKQNIIYELNRLGINQRSLYPEINKAAESILMEYKVPQL
jgi:hypothetical protein